MLKITLKSARVNAGYTQREVAEILGVNRKTVWSWENGKGQPDAKYIDKLCELYKINYNHIKFFTKQ